MRQDCRTHSSTPCCCWITTVADCRGRSCRSMSTAMGHRRYPSAVPLRISMAPAPRRPIPWTFAGTLLCAGAATARALKATEWRVAVMASSSWSHSFLTAKNHYLYPDLPADRARYEEMRDGQLDRWQSLTTGQLEDAGQQELLNWVCLAGAIANSAGGRCGRTWRRPTCTRRRRHSPSSRQDRVRRRLCDLVCGSRVARGQPPLARAARARHFDRPRLRGRSSRCGSWETARG